MYDLNWIVNKIYVNHIYSVEFQISAYVKDHHHSLLTSLAGNVVKVLNNSEILFAKLIIINGAYLIKRKS